MNQVLDSESFKPESGVFTASRDSLGLSIIASKDKLNMTSRHGEYLINSDSILENGLAHEMVSQRQHSARMKMPVLDKKAIYKSLDMSLQLPQTSHIDLTASQESLGFVSERGNFPPPTSNINLQQYDFNANSAQKMPRLKEKFHGVSVSKHAFVQNEMLASKADLLSENSVLEHSGPSPGILASAHARSKHT